MSDDDSVATVTDPPGPRPVAIGDRLVGAGHPTYVVAELSANHDQSLSRALELVEAAAVAGVDAVKIQTYRPDTLTIDSDREPFIIGPGTPWAGRRLYDLYDEAQTPWEWTGPLAESAASHGIALFSTPFDASAVTFLEKFDLPAYKVASFELVDLALVRAVAATGRPLILSTGMATADEIDEAIGTARDAGNDQLIVLRCSSAYPSTPDLLNLRTIADIESRWHVNAGLSDHTLGHTAVVAAIAIGACFIEKHLTLDRSEPGPDSAFSLEPGEFADLVTAVREADAALGTVRYGPTPAEEASRVFRRSLFVVRDLQAGDELTEENLRAIRPGHGLPPRVLPEVLGRRASRAILRGTPLAWDLIDGDDPPRR